MEDLDLRKESIDELVIYLQNTSSHENEHIPYTKLISDYECKLIVEALLHLGKCDNCGYKIHSNNISKLNSCNNCRKLVTCADRPDLGDYARINCKDWMKQE